MGYTTEFKGSLQFSEPLTPEQVKYINKLSDTRRMKRNPAICENYHDPVREAVGLPVGEEGEFTVFGADFMGQADDESVLEYNRPPINQPGLWMQWNVSEDGKELFWNGGEKFYSYIEWLIYLSKNIFQKWNNRYLTGEIAYKGEEIGDAGTITCFQDRIETYKGIRKKVFDEEFPLIEKPL